MFKDGKNDNGRPPVPAKNGHRMPGMPHSQSESNIDYRAPPTNKHNLRRGETFTVLTGDNHFRTSEDSNETLYSRGRGLSRSSSPVKLLEDIKEDQTTFSSPSPPKRSRSPMKQLFGEGGWLGKSSSFKQLSDDDYHKKGIKHWGGKIKQRVEVFVRHEHSQTSL